MRRVAIELYAHDPRIRKTAGQHERAAAAHPPGFQNLPWRKRPHDDIKEKHSARTNSAWIRSSPPVADRAAEVGQETARSPQQSGQIQIVVCVLRWHSRNGQPLMEMSNG